MRLSMSWYMIITSRLSLLVAVTMIIIIMPRIGAVCEAVRYGQHALDLDMAFTELSISIVSPTFFRRYTTGEAQDATFGEGRHIQEKNLNESAHHHALNNAQWACMDKKTYRLVMVIASRHRHRRAQRGQQYHLPWLQTIHNASAMLDDTLLDRY